MHEKLGVIFPIILICHNNILQVQKGRLQLLKHPLVGSLLHYKWKTFGQYGYFLNMLIYVIFLIFLTSFALVTLNPQSQSCKY